MVRRQLWWHLRIMDGKTEKRIFTAREPVLKRCASRNQNATCLRSGHCNDLYAEICAPLNIKLIIFF